MTSNNRVLIYMKSLNSLPDSGGGGCHVALLSVANLGRMAGLSPDLVFADLRAHVRGTRPVSDSEIWAAIDKAYDQPSQPRRASPRPAPRLASAAQQEFIRRGRGATLEDLIRASPIPPIWPLAEEPWRTIGQLYGPEELLYVGDDGWRGTLGDTIRPAAEWVEILRREGGCRYPKLMANPLTGLLGPKKDGSGLSYRADSCIAAYRYMVCEFDTIPIAQQIEFWCGIPHMPIAAITHSGKKSLHVLVRVDAAGAREWEEQIEQRLFGQFLAPLGLDSSCKNESRLTRMFGHVRADTGLPQKVLYLAPEGRAIAP